MKIELHNKTHWREDHIRAFLVRGIQAEREDLCKHGAPAMKVYVVYTRGHVKTSGYAYYNSRWMKVRLPKVNPDKVAFAHTIFHELAHTRGLTHDRMNSCATYGYSNGWREQADTKLAHAGQMLKAALTREKRAVTIRKKWEAKVRYYDNRLKLAATKAIPS
jgi:Zn-dependent peptidase ImmA (M78 family)